MFTAEDFDDGNNGLWKCLSHPSTQRHTVTIELRLGYTARSVNDEDRAALERLVLASGVRDAYMRLQALLETKNLLFSHSNDLTSLCSFEYSRLREIQVTGGVLARLVPYIAQFAPSLDDVTLSTNKGRLVFNSNEVEQSCFAEPAFRAMLQKQPALQLGVLTVIGCDKRWPMDLLASWNVQPQALVLWSSTSRWARCDHLAVILKVAEWSGFEELEIRQYERGYNTDLQPMRLIMEALAKTRELACQLVEEWSGRGISIAFDTGRNDWEELLAAAEDPDNEDYYARPGLSFYIQLEEWMA